MPLHLAVFGAAHYVAAPWALLRLPLRTCISSSSSNSSGGTGPSAALCAVGAAVFAAGVAAQALAHLALARMPRGKDARKRYPLPTPAHCALFRLSLCPHYTAEIVLYCGLLLWRQGVAEAVGGAGEGCSGGWGAWEAMLARCAPALLLAWTLCNLAVTGGRLKAWYCTAYPGCGVEARSAVIPGLY